MRCFYIKAAPNVLSLRVDTGPRAPSPAGCGRQRARLDRLWHHRYAEIRIPRARTLGWERKAMADAICSSRRVSVAAAAPLSGCCCCCVSVEADATVSWSASMAAARACLLCAAASADRGGARRPPRRAAAVADYGVLVLWQCLYACVWMETKLTGYNSWKWNCVIICGGLSDVSDGRAFR